MYDLLVMWTTALRTPDGAATARTGRRTRQQLFHAMTMQAPAVLRQLAEVMTLSIGTQATTQAADLRPRR